jgi:hypothetical protein
MIGKRNATAIGTLVERASGFAMLVALPDGDKPEHVAPALAKKVQTLPQALRRSLTWDQGPEMRDWKQLHVAAGIDVFFCDPHALWQRGSNENTNGLLRQYFPKGTDFSTITTPSSTPSPTNSTPGPANAWPSPTPPSSSPSCCCNDRSNPPFGLRDGTDNCPTGAPSGSRLGSARSAVPMQARPGVTRLGLHRCLVHGSPGDNQDATPLRP